MSVREERRCPSCQALVSADAEWCGQCFTSLQAAPVPGAAAATGPLRITPVTDGPQATRATATWACPACEHLNPLEADLCELCGTSFGALFRMQEEGPRIDPATALKRSLLLPGLGHAAVGRGADGIARAMLFAWTFGTAIVIAFAGVSSGPVLALLALYGLLAVGVYLFTAYEAYRMAQGSGPLVSSRVLLWGAVALVLVSVGMATFLIFAAARR
ncbi:MAG: zinc ribbon domain-containing protein [Actinomycetota bacterium]